MDSELKIWSDLSELPKLRDFVTDFCNLSQTPLEKESVHQLVLAVHEVTANIIEHAYHGRTDQLVKIRIEKQKDRYTVRINHWGDAFDPESRNVAPPNGSKERGYGLYIIQNCVDKISYHRDEKGNNHVIIIKKRNNE